MHKFQSVPAPVATLWGSPQQSEQILPGVWEVHTASHGGIILSQERQAAMPAALRLADPFYEEDVDWCLAIVAFEAEYRASGRRCAALLADNARSSLRAWHPDRFTAYTGEAVPEDASPVLQRRAAYTALIGEFVVTSASGDWADWVPKGKVGVVARRVTGVDALGFARYANGETIQGLVDKDAYNSSAINGFDAIGAVRIDGDAPTTKEVAL